MSRISHLFILIAFASTTLWAGDVRVRSYVRKDGTVVRSHYRSSPDGNFWNNWSTAGNVNPYTGARGTKTEPPQRATQVRVSTSAAVNPPRMQAFPAGPAAFPSGREQSPEATRAREVQRSRYEAEEKLQRELYERWRTFTQDEEQRKQDALLEVEIRSEERRKAWDAQMAAARISEQQAVQKELERFRSTQREWGEAATRSQNDQHDYRIRNALAAQDRIRAKYGASESQEKMWRREIAALKIRFRLNARQTQTSIDMKAYVGELSFLKAREESAIKRLDDLDRDWLAAEKRRRQQELDLVEVESAKRVSDFNAAEYARAQQNTLSLSR